MIIFLKHVLISLIFLGFSVQFLNCEQLKQDDLESNEKHEIDAMEMELFKKIISKMIENSNNEVNDGYELNSNEEDYNELSRIAHERELRALLRAGRALPRAGRALPRAGRALPRAGRALPRAGRALPRAG